MRFAAPPVGLFVGLFLASGANATSAQVSGIDDLVEDCGGIALTLAVTEQLSVDEVERIAEVLQARLPERPADVTGTRLDGLDAVRPDEDGLINVWRVGMADLGMPVDAFLRAGTPLNVFLVNGRQGHETPDGPTLSVFADPAAGDFVVTDAEPLIGRLGIAGAVAVPDGNGQMAVQIDLTGAAADLFGQVTADHVGSTLALMLGDRLLTAPRVMAAIEGGRLEVAGNVSDVEAEAIARALRESELIHALEVQSMTVYGLPAVPGPGCAGVFVD